MGWSNVTSPPTLTWHLLFPIWNFTFWHLLEIRISFCPHGICFFQSEILHSFNFPKTNFSVGMKPVFNLPWKSRCNFLQKRILAIWNFTFIQFSEDELFSGAWNRYLISLENLFLFPSNLYINLKKVTVKRPLKPWPFSFFPPTFSLSISPFQYSEKRCRPNVNSRPAQTPAKPAFEWPRRNVSTTPFFGKLIYNTLLENCT